MARRKFYSDTTQFIDSEKQVLWRVAGYLRFSNSKDISKESESIENQRMIIGDYIKSQSDLRLNKFYVDDGFTGLNIERQGFEQMIDDIKNNNINCVVVKDISRLGRGSKETKMLLEDTFPKLKCRVISIGENLDTHNRPDDVFDIMIQYIQMLNEKYSFDISKSTKRSLRIQREDGLFVSPQAVYGYCKDKENPHVLKIDEEPSEIVKLIYDLRINGYSLIGIANYLNEHKIDTPSMYKKRIGIYKNRKNISTKWYPQVVRDILSNITYLGHLEQYKMSNCNFKSKKYSRHCKENRIVVKNTHPPIITQDQFDKVQRIFSLCVRSAPSKRKHHLFTGFLKCADCGRAMIRSSKFQYGKEYTYYNCRTYNQIDKTACVAHSISEPILKELVFSAIKSQIYAVADLGKILDIVNANDISGERITFFANQIENDKKEIENIKFHKIELYKDWKRSKVSDSDYEIFSNNFDKDIDELNKSILSFKKQKSFFESVQKKDMQWLTDFLQYFKETQLNRTMLLSLIDVIKVHVNKEIEIVFRYSNEIESLEKLLYGKGC